MASRQTEVEDQLTLEQPAPERPVWEAFGYPLISFAFVVIGISFPEIGDWASTSFAPLILTFVLSLVVTVTTSVAFMRVLFSRTGFVEGFHFVLRKENLSGLAGGVTLGAWIFLLAMISGMTIHPSIFPYLSLLLSVVLVARGMDVLYRNQYLVYAVANSRVQADREREQKELPLRIKLLSRLTGRNGYARNTILWTGIIFCILTPSAGIVGNVVDSPLLVGFVSTLIQFGLLALWVKTAERGSFFALLFRSSEKPMIRQR